ncbi:ABC transporter substrate-binding protein [Devosia sp. CN2-171]|uniref:ABC transporter substrate-binding protein n=1 Tax=Devosia sp. CN2-171 TaxID=3400909 RepID=UPI003BF7B47A
MRTMSWGTTVFVGALGVTLLTLTSAALAEPVTLTLGSWRTEDLAVWQDKVLPAFEAAHPDINVEFAPINTNEYNAAIQSQIEGGAGPDLITCRPFDVNNEWIGRGYFIKLDGLAGLENFTDTAKAAWSTGGATYCVPVAAVLAGFYYNIDIFNELGLKVPTTAAEFISTLQAIKDNGKYTPLAEGSAESWQLAYNGLYSIGPAYWKGEEGRLGLIDGTKKLTDPDFVSAISAFQAWKPFLPAGQESLSYSDMTQLFTLGKAAILPDGSWNINQVTATGLNVGVFGPPAIEAGGQRYLQEMPDMAIGINASSKNQDAAKTFLTWVSGPEFQQIYVNTAPGFFAMSNQPVKYENALAQAFADLKTGALLTPRLALDRLSAGTPPLDDEIWRLLQVMMTSDTTPEQVAEELQTGLSSWYSPQMPQ